jgi:hypothetical protein
MQSMILGLFENSLASSSTAIPNESLEIGMCNFVWMSINRMSTYYLWNIVCKSSVTIMATVQPFEVISDKFNVEQYRNRT